MGSCEGHGGDDAISDNSADGSDHVRMMVLMMEMMMVVIGVVRMVTYWGNGTDPGSAIIVIKIVVIVLVLVMMVLMLTPNTVSPEY